MKNEFVVKWLIDFWDNDDGLYLVDEVIEAENIDDLIEKLDNGIENDEFTPEKNVPNWHDLGDFNIEYVQINTNNGEQVYKDNDFSEELKLIPEKNKF